MVNEKVNEKEIAIRGLELADLNTILEIEQFSFSCPWSREVYIYELTDNVLANYWGCFLEHKEVEVYGFDPLTSGQRLIAFGGYWLIMDEGHIANVACHPLFRRQGISELLMRYIIADCFKNGGRHMTLEVRESNIPAQSLYNKLGFFSVGKRPGYYTNPVEDALIMWRDL